MLSSGILCKIAAGAGVLFVGYCIYFDRKRRSDPLYFQKVKERRKAAKTSQVTTGSDVTPMTSVVTSRSISETRSEGPRINKEVFTNEKSIQEFSVNEFHMGQQCLQSGDLENGVKHMTMSVVTSSNPGYLMNIISSSYIQKVVQMIHLSIPAAKKIFDDAYRESMPQKVTTLIDDDDQD